MSFGDPEEASLELRMVCNASKAIRPRYIAKHGCSILCTINAATCAELPFLLKRLHVQIVIACEELAVRMGGYGQIIWPRC